MQTHLKLLIKGFQVFEQRIIETTVRLSENRSPRLSQMPDASPSEVDVVIIDGGDADAMAWAKSNLQSLENATTVWIDVDPLVQNAYHSRMDRPILWVNLPIIISRVLDEQSLEEVKSQPSAAQPKAPAVKTKLSKAPPVRAKILVVDDSKAVRDYLANILKQNGYQVTLAEDGEEALESASARYFDCVLMDVLMPGMDGYKACREIRRLKQHSSPMPVLMLTSRTSPFDKIRGKMAGCDAYLTKPVKLKDLLDAVEEHAVV